MAELASVSSQASRTWSRSMGGMCVSSNSSGSFWFSKEEHISFICSGFGTTTWVLWWCLSSTERWVNNSLTFTPSLPQIVCISQPEWQRIRILSVSRVTLREALRSSCEGQIALAVEPDHETSLSWEIIFSCTSFISVTVTDLSDSVRNSSTFRLSKSHDLLRSKVADSTSNGVLDSSIHFSSPSFNWSLETPSNCSR